MKNTLKPVSAVCLLLPLMFAPVLAQAQAAAPIPAREVSSVNKAVSSLMAGGAPVAPAAEAAAPRAALTPEQAVQKAVQAPAVVGSESLKQDAPAPSAPAAVTTPAKAPVQADGALVVTAPPKQAKATKPVVEEAEQPKKAPVAEAPKPKKRAKSALTWNEKAANTAGVPAAAASARGARQNEYEVSDIDYNRFVFPVPVAQVVSPAGSNLLYPPLYMSGNKHVLLRLAGASNRAVQVVAELEDGSVQEFYLKPSPIRGVTKEMGVREYRQAQARASDAAGAANPSAPSAADMQLLERFSIGQVPAEFEETADLPPEVHFERFWVKPIAVWTNAGNTRVEAWRLIGRPGLAATVAPPQFYRPGVRAVLLENDVVDGKTHPLLLLVTDSPEE